MKIPAIKKRSKVKYTHRRPNTINQSRPVYNYRSSRNESNRPYNRGDEPKVRTPILGRNYLKYIVLSAVIISAGYLLMLAPTAEVKLNGQAVISRPENTYEVAINQYLRQSALNYTKITFNGDKLSSQIKSEFPEITEIKVAMPLFNRQPKVRITLADPSVLLRAFGDDTYILDGQGRALVRQSEASKTINANSLTIINDTSNQPVQLGKTFLSEQQINFIDETARQAKENKLQVGFINLAGGASQLNVKYKDVEYLVKYSFFADARQSSGAYFAMREQLKRENKTPKEYVDLRIPDRAYIK